MEQAFYQYSNYGFREVGCWQPGWLLRQGGAMRDMIQNHVMQLLALTAMEPPSSLDPEAIRDESGPEGLEASCIGGRDPES